MFRTDSHRLFNQTRIYLNVQPKICCYFDFPSRLPEHLTLVGLKYSKPCSSQTSGLFMNLTHQMALQVKR